MREYSSLDEAMAENAASRVYNGVHFEFEGAMGCDSGVGIANYIYENNFLERQANNQRQVVTTSGIPDAISDILYNSQTSGYVALTCDETPPYPFVAEE